MSKKLTTVLTITLLAISTVLAALPMANAEIYFAPTLDPTSGPPGTRVTVSAGAGGASPFATVTAYWDSLSGMALGSTSANITGAYELEVTIPKAVNGEHYIVVNDGESESRGSPFQVTAGLVIWNYYLRVLLPVGNGEVYVNGTLHTGVVLAFGSGEVANISAVPDSGWTFNGWAFVDGGTSNPLYLTMTENRSAQAIFAEAPPFEVATHNVTVEANTYVVETVSNSSVSEFDFNQTLKRIRFKVDGAAGTAGFCNVTVPSELMSGDFSIYKDDAPLIEGVDYSEAYNGTHYLFNITYEHSNHTIEITSTTVIPEFSSLIMLTLLTLATLTTIIAKKKLKR